jgi:predicted NBD/HSP70 family sugar kinase
MGQATKRQLSLATGLTFQAASSIVEAMVERGLIRKVGRHTGGLGQPSAIFEVDPLGSLSIGVEIGRHNLVIVGVGLTGVRLAKLQFEYEYPLPSKILPLVTDGIPRLIERLKDFRNVPLAGVGVSAPYLLGGWAKLLGFPTHVETAWREVVLQDEVQKLTNMPVYFENDGTSACAAELLLGVGQELQSFLYFFLGTFTGGGLVLDGALQFGPNRNAGALGPMPVPPSRLPSVPPPDGGMEILMNRASLHALLRHFHHSGYSSLSEHDIPIFSQRDSSALTEWMDDATDALAYAAISALCVVDVQAIVLGGALPQSCLETITSMLAHKVNLRGHDGICVPAFRVGTVAGEASAIGAAMMPFYNEFTPNRSSLLAKHKPDGPAFAESAESSVLINGEQRMMRMIADPKMDSPAG